MTKYSIGVVILIALIFYHHILYILNPNPPLVSTSFKLRSSCHIIGSISFLMSQCITINP